MEFEIYDFVTIPTNQHLLYNNFMFLKKMKKIALIIFLFPLTIFLDLIFYAFIKNCPSCGNFGQWLANEGSLSFPIVVMLTEWLEQVIESVKLRFNR